MQHDFTSIIELILGSEILSEQGKKEIILTLQDGEPFPDGFAQEIQDFFAREKEFLQQKLQAIEKQKKDTNHYLSSIKKEIAPNKINLVNEYQKFMNQKKNAFAKELKKITNEYEKGAEKIVHEEVEESQIDALHDFLSKPKK